MERTEERTWSAPASVGDWLVVFGLVLFVAVIPLLWSSTLASPFFTLKAAAVYPVGLLLILGVLLRSRPGESAPGPARLGHPCVRRGESRLATLRGRHPSGILLRPLRAGNRLRDVPARGGSPRRGPALPPARKGALRPGRWSSGAVALTVLMWLQRSGTGWAVSHLGIPAQAGHAPGASLGQPVWSGAYVAVGLVAALVLFVSAPRLRWSLVYAAGAAVCLSGVVISSVPRCLAGGGAGDGSRTRPCVAGARPSVAQVRRARPRAGAGRVSDAAAGRAAHRSRAAPRSPARSRRESCPPHRIWAGWGCTVRLSTRRWPDRCSAGVQATSCSPGSTRSTRRAWR